jgi:hypothetical protein
MNRRFTQYSPPTGDDLIALWREEALALRRVLHDAAPFLSDVGLTRMSDSIRFAAVKASVSLALRARAGMLREDAPQLWSSDS